ncbi:hypothetical protein HDU88_001431 [Geranomyces variabilis]|nr:hypothetical protein HDU88_001431 [Geranomyces variabilis]
MHFAARSVLLALALTPIVAVPFSSERETPIKNVVLLTLDGRSFDNYLGYITDRDARINGLSPGQRYCNQAPTGDVICTNRRLGKRAREERPCATSECVREQMFGRLVEEEDETVVVEYAVPQMEGFAISASKIWDSNSSDVLRDVMDCNTPQTTSVTTRLALEYAVFDAWFSAVPGPSHPNRLFLMSGTSSGTVDEADMKTSVQGYETKSIFRELAEHGVSWKNYFVSVPSSIVFRDVRTTESLSKLRLYSEFGKDAHAGTLPAFSQIDPDINASGEARDVGRTEEIIKDVYEALRASPQWNQTLFLITFADGGGYYDHVVPPLLPIRDTAGRALEAARLGVRVPTIAISPLIPRGTVVKEPYEHSSIPATIARIFQLPSGLSARSAAARPITSDVFSLRKPRHDIPWTLD